LKTTNEGFAGNAQCAQKGLEYNFPDEGPVSDDDLKIAEHERNKRLKSLEWLLYGVGAVAWTVMGVAMWNPVEHWSRSGRHSLMVLSWLAYACFGACRLILMQKRTDLKAAPSPLSTLDLSQQTEGPVEPVRSDHWSEGSSEVG
jgi:hypothetical protein